MDILMLSLRSSPDSRRGGFAPTRGALHLVTSLVLQRGSNPADRRADARVLRLRQLVPGSAFSSRNNRRSLNMNASRTLMAAVAAATIVGTVGFVSAQTTDSTAAPAAAPADTMAAPATPTAPSGNMATPNSSDTAAPMQGNSTSEPAPKADRN
jgi:hypothetical protein